MTPATDSLDQDTRLALALQGRPEFVVHATARSAETHRTLSVAWSGVVASSVRNERDLRTGDEHFDVGLIPVNAVADWLLAELPSVEERSHPVSESVTVRASDSRAVIEAVRSGDPALVGAVVSELGLPAAASDVVGPLATPQFATFRVRSFDVHSRTCRHAFDWTSGGRGWCGVELSRSSLAEDQHLVRITTVSEKTIRARIIWMLADLVRSPDGRR